MSRIIFAVVVGLLFVGGCGSNPDPTLPGGKPEEIASPPVTNNPPVVSQPPVGTTPESPGAPLSPASPDAPQTGWQLDQTKQVIPNGPVKGMLAGVEVVPLVQIEGTDLFLRTYKAGTKEFERGVKIELAPMLIAGQRSPTILDRTWNVRVDSEPGQGVPVVWREVLGKTAHLYEAGYALTLALGPRKDGKVAGRIALSLTDEEKSYLAGTFEVPCPRSPTERPGADDAPYLAGEIVVTGAKADAEIHASYVGFTPMGIYFKSLHLPLDSATEQLARWTRDESDQPRTSALLAGDGQSRPFRYEHVKAIPGKYLLSASVDGGPAVWKWVDLPAGGTVSENLVLDVTKTGGLEVSVPATVTGKVYLAPASDPAQPPLELPLFIAFGFQVVRQDGDIVSGKALMKNLGPGKYEVRAGELRGTVEIVAGKTAEMALMPPKSP